MPPPEIQVTRAEFEGMEARQERMEEMLRDMHKALMVPQPGQDKSLVDRFAAVANGFENGERGIRFVVWLLGILAALGISIKMGFRP